MMSDVDNKELKPTDEFRDILMFSAVPAYLALLTFGIIVGQVAVGSVFMVMVLLGQYALKKTMIRCDISLDKLISEGLYGAAFYPVLILSVMHYATNVLFAGINNPASSVTAFALCYLMLFISIKTHVWFGYLHERRRSKAKAKSVNKKSKK